MKTKVDWYKVIHILSGIIVLISIVSGFAGLIAGIWNNNQFWQKEVATSVLTFAVFVFSWLLTSDC